MKKISALALFGALGMASSAMAIPVLQFDVNGFQINTPVGFGANYTGAVTFVKGNGFLNDLLALPNGIGGGSSSLGTGGTTLSQFQGTFNFVNGVISGGNILVRNNLGQQYTTNIRANSGQIQSFIGGGFTLQALTTGGLFSAANWGTVNIAPWFNAGNNGALAGSLLQFNWNPAAGNSADMDLYVDIVPLPTAAWAGLGTLAGVAAVRRFRRR